MDLDAYLNRARDRARLPSDRRLADALGVSHNAIRNYRLGIGAPSPEKMLKLAELAQVPAAVALVDRLAWQADGPQSRQVVAFLQSLIPSGGTVGAKYNPEQEYCDKEAPYSIHYGKNRVVDKLCIMLKWLYLNLIPWRYEPRHAVA